MAHQKIQPEFLFDEEKIAQLKQIAPECFEDGKLNFETLRQNLGDWVQEEEEGELEHFGLNWPGKKEARRVASLPPEGTLEPVYGEGLKADGSSDADGVNDSKNIFIEGENLEVLKILQKSYANKIKMIYIDPPYNTGNDFVYDDDFTEPLQEYLRRTGQVDEEGKPMTTNKKSDGRFHSKWLSMMYPRLRLARNLLKEDGVIFVSIDDNEVHNLRAIMNEIFGEENFVAQIIWQRAFAPINTKKTFSESHDYILCYFNNSDEGKILGLERDEKADSRYKNPDNDPRGVWQSDNLSVGPVVQSKLYPIITPGGREVFPPNGRCWVLTKDRLEEFINDNRIWFGKDGNNVPRIKRFLSEVGKRITPMTLWKREEVGDSQDGRREVKALFENKAVFDYPKPVKLLRRIIELTTEDGDLIMDFFSGSASLAHAMLESSKSQKIDRTYILVQLPEILEENSIAREIGFQNIADISRDRIKKAEKKLDITKGFKSFKLVNSNYKKWQNYSGENVGQLEDALDLFSNSPLREDWSRNKLLTELMLLEGFPLDAQQEPLEIGTNKIVKVESELVPNTLLICLDEEIEENLIEELELEASTSFICLDRAISNQNKLRLSDKGLIKTI